MLRATVLLAVVAVSLPRQEPASESNVSGTVKLPPAPAFRKGRRPHPCEKYVQGPAIVFIDKVAGDFKPPPKPAVMGQKNCQYAPMALPILRGATVEFTNEDDEVHNVFSRSPAKEMELGRWGKGDARQVVFDKPGLVRIRCEVHHWMHAVVAVLENPYFAVTDPEGRFSIAPRVPPGKYRIWCFHEDYSKTEVEDPLRVVGKDLDVPDTGRVSLEFDLQ